MKNTILRLLILLAGLTAGQSGASDMFVYLGTHRSGPQIGLSLARFDTETGALTKPEWAVETRSPSFFVIHPDGRHLYTCNEEARGGLSACEIEPGTGRLVLLNRESSSGDDPCQVNLDRTGRYALVANYSSGTIAVLALKPDGALGNRTAFVQHSGSSVHPERQQHAYAHGIITDPSNRFALAADLGADKVFIYRFNEKDGSLQTNDVPFATLAPGSGPRHLTFHPNGRWVYVINELTSSITVFNWDAAKGALTESQTISTLPGIPKGVSTCAELEVHPNGKFLYASNRGHDSLAVFALDPANGRLSAVEHVSSGGKTPRFFTFDPTGRWILCANHGSDNVVVFRVDEKTGRLKQTGEPVAAPNPFCVRFLPRK